MGFVLDGMSVPLSEMPDKPWFFSVFIFGLGFVIFFNILGISTQKVGITIATVAFKMCMIIPVIAAVFLYNDSVTFLKVAGIILACVAIIMASVKKEKHEVEKKYLFLPVLLFFGSGFLDTYFKYAEKNYIQESEANLFCSLAFLVAGVAGLLYLLFTIFAGKAKFESKSILWGVLLGIPNYASLYFLFKALRMEGFESSVVFPLNNMGIVATSALAAFFIFREKLSPLNWAGIALAIVSIAMIAWS
jgi:drug/metabolite transporter (DMT)-like permease